MDLLYRLTVGVVVGLINLGVSVVCDAVVTLCWPAVVVLAVWLMKASSSDGPTDVARYVVLAAGYCVLAYLVYRLARAWLRQLCVCVIILCAGALAVSCYISCCVDKFWSSDEEDI